MAEATNPESFEQIIEWAYSTLPQKIRRLPDFPGIQVVDEPPRRYWRRCQTGRNGAMELSYWDCKRHIQDERSFAQVKYAGLDLCFRGPFCGVQKEICGPSETGGLA